MGAQIFCRYSLRVEGDTDWFTCISSKTPQTTVCTANVQLLPLVGTSVQMTLVWLVVVTGQSGPTGLQLKVISFEAKFVALI